MDTRGSYHSLLSVLHHFYLTFSVGVGEKWFADSYETRQDLMILIRQQQRSTFLYAYGPDTKAHTYCSVATGEWITAFL